MNVKCGTVYIQGDQMLGYQTKRSDLSGENETFLKSRNWHLKMFFELKGVQESDMPTWKILFIY